VIRPPKNELDCSQGIKQVETGFPLPIRQKGKMDTIKSKWELLLQCRPDIRGIIGSAKLIGGHIGHNENNDRIFNFITARGTFSYNEMTRESERKLEIR
jgi:hypothetical protein